MTEIELMSLRKEFDTPSGTEIAVDDVDLTIADDDFVSFVGPSGCGKTTTLRCIAGLEQPTSGSILFDSNDVTEVPPNNRNIAMMFQNIALYPHMTIWENISYPLKVNGVSKEKRRQNAAEAAEIMQISDLLEKYPGQVSGGQQQRAALARTIVQDPIAFLMDEPLSDLDAKLKVEIRKEIQKVHRKLGKPTVYVTHDQEEAMTMSDKIAVMSDGNIVQFGERDEIYYKPNTLFVAEFIGHPSINGWDCEIRSLSRDLLELELFGRTIPLSIEAIHDASFFEASSVASSVTLGVRPQDVQIGEPEVSHFDGTVTIFDPVDDRAHTIVDGPDGEIRAVIPYEAAQNHGVEEGAAVLGSLRTENAYLFDTDTEKLVAKGSIE